MEPDQILRRKNLFVAEEGRDEKTATSAKAHRPYLRRRIVYQQIGTDEGDVLGTSEIDLRPVLAEGEFCEITCKPEALEGFHRPRGRRPAPDGERDASSVQRVQQRLNPRPEILTRIVDEREVEVEADVAVGGRKPGMSLFVFHGVAEQY